MPTENHQLREAVGIAEFCRLHSMSVGTYYAMQHKGEGPRTFTLGIKVLISREAMADWRRAREAAQAKKLAAKGAHAA